MLVRAEPRGFAVYLTRRNSRSRFMPDAYVFPGGAVDASDGEPPLAFAVAALRELFEEAGILIASDARGERATLDARELARLRERCAAGASLTGDLAARGLRLDTRELTYYSNWITPASEAIRFDAHFFIARAPHGQAAAADAVEVHDGRWTTPREALDDGERGDILLRFPTRKHLERLARYDDIDALLEHARSRTIVPVLPYDDGTEHYGLPGGGDSW